jgi:hypothetical protein
MLFFEMDISKKICIFASNNPFFLIRVICIRYETRCTQRHTGIAPDQKRGQRNKFIFREIEIFNKIYIMKNIILKTAILLILAGGLSCGKNNDIDMSIIDFSNIENLYEQPLPVIQKCIYGKWGVYSVFSDGVIYNITYPENTFIEFKNDYYSVSSDIESQSFYFTWKKLAIENWRSPIYGCTTYAMWGGDRINNWYFERIKNDTLFMCSHSAPVGYSVVRIK